MKKCQPFPTAQEIKNNAPIIVVDFSYQNESLNNGPINIKIEFETKKNILAKTSAYCIFIQSFSTITNAPISLRNQSFFDFEHLSAEGKLTG